MSATPPSAAPVTEVTPKTTASSSSSRLLKNWNSAAPTVCRGGRRRAPPARPAMPADSAKRPTRNQRMSRPRVPHAAGLSRMAMSIRPTTPRRSTSSSRAISTKKTAITKT